MSISQSTFFQALASKVKEIKSTKINKKLKGKKFDYFLTKKYFLFNYIEFKNISVHKNYKVSANV